ncbi:response regulator [Marinibactrum halimedae]|uniref:response regulator n=1 Tax=Marinibactrum halimedae TaxID=1444977 RepID=UPI001E40460E|nr:response regulator [Marinibactrum halimedae]MCD9458296.1 response regulator [Marinibactrum halimedae]
MKSQSSAAPLNESNPHSNPLSTFDLGKEILSKIIYEIAQGDPYTAMHNAVARLGQATGSDYCTLNKFDEASNLVKVKVGWHHSDKHPIEGATVPFDITNQEILKRNLESGEPLIINDTRLTHEKIDPIIAPWVASGELQSLLLVPIKQQGSLRVKAFLVLSCGHPKQWQREQIECCHLLGNALALVFSRTELIEALNSQAKRLSYAMEASRDGLWDFDPTTGDCFYSLSCLRMYGYEKSHLPQKASTAENYFIHPDDLHRAKQILKEALEGDRDSYENEYRGLHKDGHIVWTYCRAKVVRRNKYGKATRIVGINMDITPFKESERQLKKAMQYANAANQAKSEFLTRMSHEIRTPMNAIIGMAHLLRDTPLNQTQHAYLKSIDTSANSLLYTINDILDFTKIETGDITLDNSHFDLDELLRSVARDTDAKATSKHLEVVYDLSPELPRYLRGDPIRLGQVLNHLLNNAIKFTEKGEIRFSIQHKKIRPDATELVFSVKDTGIGIPKEKLESLFEPFTQADGSSRRRFGGAGLGLSICKQLITLMKGKLSVESAENQGSTFSFNALFEDSHLGARPIRENPDRFENLKTLIVDDNDQAREVLERTGKAIKLDVASVANGEEAIALLEQHNQKVESHSQKLEPHSPKLDPHSQKSVSESAYKVIVLDYDMPGLNGLETAQRIQHNEIIAHKPRVILVSSYRRNEIFSSKPDFIHGFLHKPISPSSLFDTIYSIKPVDMMDARPEDNIDKLLDGARVLLAEDNIVNQKVAVGLLKKKGIEVIVANNGQEAIDELYHSPPGYFDLVLMDMEMPIVDGYDATKTIRKGQHHTNIPIIAMTAHAMSGDREQCLKCGMNAYLTKPVNPKLLYRTIADFVEISVDSDD